MTEVYIDGASRGNPGPSGAGIYIKADSGQIRVPVPLGTMTNHHAEFAALSEALRICRSRGLKALSIRTDSQIVADAVEKRYVKRSEFARYLEEILDLMNGFDLCFVKWIPSKQNREADSLSKKAVQMSIEADNDET
ncbi:reverse transcriptase-like protein [Alteribacter natronophilus]|uniref:reverse transcriptase-like protein n=1 Tax=Alteribacter natronophilus TaxID=2583810 RepID=UPI00110DC133|nr:reverse transcriptase-like protein [Alteribacter natronophilus]TMW74076.1 reverse transcriptase-like protein [Alteribacter natronophilus]